MHYADVSIAKNYLSIEEMQELNEIVTMYLDYAIRQARRHIPMTMADWASKLDAFLQFNDAEILHDKGKVTKGVKEYMAANPDAFDPKKYSKQGMAEVQKYVEQKLQVCGSQGKA